MFELVQDIIQINILSKLEQKIWPLARKQDFFQIWPSDLLFDPTPTIIKLVQDSIKTFWASLRKIWQNIWPLERKQFFSKIWPSDLLLYSTQPNFFLQNKYTLQMVSNTLWLIRNFFSPNLLSLINVRSPYLPRISSNQSESLTMYSSTNGLYQYRSS